jgi:hypothetical protein
MKLFKCQVCSQVLYFENTTCDKCGFRLGYEPKRNVLYALEQHDATWRIVGESDTAYRFCANVGYDVCNWLIDASDGGDFCLACRHNGIIPDLSDAQNLVNWRKIEAAKHRLFYTLLRLDLPLPTRAEDKEGLVFNFLADSPNDPAARVMTGHDSGLITLAQVEADDAERERRRTQLREPYRTLLGHFRHELGHYFWNRLVRDQHVESEFAAMFGDFSRDYGQALQAYYASGAPADWQTNFVSAYATAHPWEDFAETWAHYLHIVDTTEMAAAFDLHLEPRIDPTGQLDTAINFNPYRARNFQNVIDNWLPMAFAMNNINRCMGQPDFYPFVLSVRVIEKLAFVHEVIHRVATVDKVKPPAAEVPAAP